MSSRQLRKLRKAQEDVKSENKVTGPEDDLENDDEPIQRKPRTNVFSGFAALGDDNGDNDDDDGGEDGDEPALGKSQPAIPPAKKTKRKSKKRKNTKKGQRETVDEPAGNGDEMDEIDRALEQLRVGDTETKAARLASADDYSKELSRLLSVNATHLKVLNEMRNLFGRDTIQSAHPEGDPQAATYRRRLNQGDQHVTLEQYLKGLPGQSISKMLLRRNPFVEGKEYWPRASAGGLSMKEIGVVEGDCTEFTFTHDKTYDTMEANFFAYVQMHDPMQLVHFLHRNPYHVSSLIQVSKVAKQDQNSALAGDLCERALFTFGRVTLSGFRQRLQEGRARLSFRRPENRQFWLAGYNYIKSLIQRGTFRTCLEWAKLFLSLSPADEYGILNFIHVLAIRARESRWLLSLFDNKCFSQIMSENTPNREYIKQTAVLAKLQLRDVEGARSMLAVGMGGLPWLYCSLFSALGLDTPKAIWGLKPRDSNEELFTELYIHLTKDLWNNTQATSLLQEVAKSIPRPAYETLPKTDDTDLSLARFVYLDNTPSLMALAPKSMLHSTPNFDFDPLPPPADENIFSSKAQSLPWDAASNRGLGGGNVIFWDRVAGLRGPAAEGVGDIAMQLPGDLPPEPPQALVDQIDGEENAAVRGMLHRFLEMLWPGTRQTPGGGDNGGIPPGAWDEAEADGNDSDGSDDVFFSGDDNGYEHPRADPDLDDDDARGR